MRSRRMVCILLPFLTLLQYPNALCQEGSAVPDTHPLVTVAQHVEGVQSCRISLNGTWQFTTTPANDFWNDTLPTGWKSIRVPGEPMMQGFIIKHDIEYAYRTTIHIPRDYGKKRTILRFNGVYSHARVWIDGQFVRDHDGGFTSWDCDITTLVNPGSVARLTLGITDRVDDISFGSGYAKHPIGGILRGVELLALPEDYIRTFCTTVHFDSLYRHAILSIQSSLNKQTSAAIDLSLFDPSGKQLALKTSHLLFSELQLMSSVDIPFASPIHWDAEHPQLYTLKARLIQNGAATELVSRQLGFREVQVRGNKLFVNGMPVKLRGACRHDIHPTQGRSTTPEQDKLDVTLAKEANFNFIRTSHYPPSEDFLNECDRQGIYVEEETAICFVGTYRQEPYQSKGVSQNNPAYTGRYLSQLSEMIDRDRNHPSVIIWSIGNENEYGSNFQSEYHFVKSVDRSRPVIFSYPGNVPKDSTCYDIVSMHYVAYDGHTKQLGIEMQDFGLPSIPVLHDEWAHVPCYNTPTLKSDLNVRNFWGESIKRMWDACYESDGLGGAIWGYIDECFMLPDTVVGYGPWGIIDVWRRKKPEFWLTRKAYSPVRVLRTHFASYDPKNDLIVPVYNRFDHTNLRELRIQVAYLGSPQFISAPDIPPHAKGSFKLPHSMLRGEPINLKFLQRGSMIVDEELLTFGSTEITPAPPSRPIRVTESGLSLNAAGDRFTLSFNKKTGLIENCMVDGKRIIVSGPYLHLTSSGGPISWNVDSLLDLTSTRWQLSEMTFEKKTNELHVAIQGQAGSSDVRFEIVVDGNGEIRVSYDLANLPERFREVGIRFVLDKEIGKLSWSRNALWSLYPDDHIGRPVGTALKLAPSTQREHYREKPANPWSSDTKDFYFYGRNGSTSDSSLPVPVDFRATKEKIFQYTLTEASGHGIRMISDGADAARAMVNADGTTTWIIANEWNYSNISWGNYDRTKKLPPRFRGESTLQLVHAEGKR